MGYILGLETTCDDSGLGVFDEKTQKILTHSVYSQNELHAKFGGVVPEIASRLHYQALPLLWQNFFLQKKIPMQEVTTFAVSSSPGLIGSLLVGVNFMKCLAWSFKKEVLGVDHLEAHLLSVMLENPKAKFPYLCYLLSGGHTMAVIVEGVGKYELLGKTEDDALGEAFDKVAKILGLEYPGGPKIEKLAKLWDGDLWELPIPLKNRQDYNFSYSGLKTALKRLADSQGIKGEKQKLLSWEEFLQLPKKKKELMAKLAASFQKTAFLSLLHNLKKILKKRKIKTFVIAGGVANNNYFFEKFTEFCEQENMDFFVPKKEYCSDNGAMIAFCAYLYQQHSISRSLEASSQSELLASIT